MLNRNLAPIRMARWQDVPKVRVVHQAWQKFGLLARCVSMGNTLVLQLDSVFQAGIGSFRQEHIIDAELDGSAGQVVDSAVSFEDIERRRAFS